MPHLRRGALIVIEGIDGSGKSTLARELHKNLMKKDLPCHLTKEPGGTELGKKIRSLVHEKTMPLCPISEFLLFAADRAQHAHEIITPALEKKEIVISDRLSDSSLVYQGYGRGLDLKMLASINQWALQGVRPALTVYLKVDVATALQRIYKRNDKLTSFEQEDRAFFDRLVQGFDELYKDRSDVLVIDGIQSADSVITYTTEVVLQWINTHLLA